MTTKLDAIIQNAKREERQLIIDTLWEWMEIEVVCEKPNMILAQLIDKINSLRPKE